MADLGSLLGAAGIGGAIGQAIVRLELDTAKYQAELKSAQASTVAGTNTMGAATSKFAGLAQAALLGVGVAAVAGAALSVKAAIEANEAHLKLQNTFKNNEALSDSSVAAFERQADALRDLTGVDDEAIISGQALLGQFDLTGKQVMDLTPLVVDLSAKLGIDLDAAFKAAGKAATGNTGALARYIGAIEVGSTKSETFTNVLDKLGRAQGFAAERAEAEPWRVLGAQFEELAEVVGQAILPALQGLTDIIIDLIPVVEAVGSAIADAFDAATYTDIPVIGEAFKGLGVGIQAVGDAVNTSGENIRRNGLPLLSEMKQTADLAASGITNLGDNVDHFGILAAARFEDAGKDVRGFANMTTKEMKDWSRDIGDALADTILALEDLTTESGVTERDFIKAHRAMRREARETAGALREIAREDWVNPRYVEFISKQGPDWVRIFADLTETQQRRAQQAWKDSTKFTDDQNASLEKIGAALDKLDRGNTKHTVEIEYRYIGFDPSKPGMAGSAQQR
jgi:hypothetical protein